MSASAEDRHVRRVTLIGPTHPYKGGVAQHTTALAGHLESAGCKVDLLSWSAQYPSWFYPGELELAEPGSEPGFPRTRRSLAWYDPGSWWRSARVPSEQSELVVFSLLNGIQIPAYRTILQRVRHAGIRTVALCHNVRPHETDRIQLRLIDHFLRSVDAVVVHSHAEAAAAWESGARRVVVARLPFHFPAEPPRREPDPAPTHRLLAFGFVRPYKGIDVLIDAVALAQTQVGVTVAGEFWMPAEELMARAEDRGVASRVHLREGYLKPDAVLDLLTTHDAAVLPYRSGTGSQQPAVAHLAGTPVIASRVGDLSEQVRDGHDGFLVEPGNAVSLASAIDRLYAPGVLSDLRGHVIAPDPEREWSAYLTALLEA